MLEFQAYRLTSTGLAGLMGLESLECLSIHGLDSWASDTACFRMRPSLKELHLGCEYELPPEAVQRLRDVPDLSMRFRWVEWREGGGGGPVLDTVLTSTIEFLSSPKEFSWGGSVSGQQRRCRG